MDDIAPITTVDKSHQNLAIIGHVDHGKSTLVGRLLFETSSVPEHIIEQYREEAALRGKLGFEFAYAMDNLVEECECGTTIDIAHQRFDTEKYYLTIVDMPGHRDFVGNMITDVSRTDHVILVIATDDGVALQTCKHIFLAWTLGIEEFIIAVDKMDVIDYSEDSYKQVKEEVQQLLQQVWFNSDDTGLAPVSAFEGSSIAEPSESMTWFDGLAVLKSLNNLPEPSPPTDVPLRVPIQDVYTVSGIGMVPVGRVGTGMLRIGDNVRFMPSGAGGEVKTIEMHHEEVPETGPDDNVGPSVRSVGKDDIRHGGICGPADDPLSAAKTFTARIVVMQHPSIITADHAPVIHTYTAQVTCTFESLDQRLDPALGEVAEEGPDFVKAGGATVVTLHPQKPLNVEPSLEIAELGSFAIRDMGRTIVAGKVLEINEQRPVPISDLPRRYRDSDHAVLGDGRRD